MFSNPVLDVVIGLVFIYLLYSLLATIIQEIIATKLAFRAKILEKAIFRMLEDGKSSGLVKNAFAMFIWQNRLKDKKIAAWFYAHPLIKYLGEDNYQSKPSYLSAQNFSKVMLDLLRGNGNQAINDVQQLNDSIQAGNIFHLPIDLVSDSNNPAIKALRHQLGKSMQNGKGDPENTETLNPDTRLFLQTIWKEAGGDVEKFRLRLEQWFDDTMERATGWYKKHTQNVLLLIGFLLAISFNIDSIGIVRKLRNDPKLREQLVQSANLYLEKSRQQYPAVATLTDSERKDAALLQQHAASLLAKADTLIDNEISKVNTIMGLGWHAGKDLPAGDGCNGRNGFLCLKCNGQDSSAVIGWIITALALSFGAPFWFDLLSKLMRLRGAGSKADEEPAGNKKSPAMQPVTPAVIHISTQNGEEAVG